MEGELPAGVGGWAGVVYPDPISGLPVRVFSSVSFGCSANHDLLVVSHFLPRLLHHLRGAEVRVVFFRWRHHRIDGEAELSSKERFSWRHSGASVGDTVVRPDHGGKGGGKMIWSCGNL